MISDIPSDTWFWKAQYKFVWDSDTFIDYLELMKEVMNRLIKEYSSTPKNADILVSPEIGILSCPAPQDTNQLQLFLIYIDKLKIRELNTTLFSEFKRRYRVHRDLFTEDLARELREIHGDKAEIIITRLRKRKQLNKHFKSIANKSLNHRREISPQLRYQVLLRDKSTCQMCGRSAPSVEVEVDHKIPVAWDKDWKTSSNLDDYQVLCKECNLGKGDMSWLESLLHPLK